MAHKCYISFKTEDAAYKEAVQKLDGVEYVDRSLDQAIDSDDEDYILRKIREDYLADSTVTILLIGKYGAERRGRQEQRFIKRELQGSLYEGVSNSRSGILGVVLPEMLDSVYRDSYTCTSCGGSHNCVAINDDSTIKEYSYNYYIPHDKCSHSEDDRYCVLVRWNDFAESPATYIARAFEKRSAPIANKVRVRP